MKRKPLYLLMNAWINGGETSVLEGYSCNEWPRNQSLFWQIDDPPC